MTTVVRKENWGVVVASGSGKSCIIIIPSYSFYFSVRDSCNILSSSSSSCFLILSSSSWARAESSMARRRSESGLEAEMELVGLEVSPYSTSTPSGMLLEWHWGGEGGKWDPPLFCGFYWHMQAVNRYTVSSKSLWELKVARTVAFTTCNYAVAMQATLTCVPTCHSGYWGLHH